MTDHSLIPSGGSTAYGLIDDLAEALFREADPAGVWAAEDEITRIYYKRQAQQKIRARGYFPDIRITD